MTFTNALKATERSLKLAIRAWRPYRCTSSASRTAALIARRFFTEKPPLQRTHFTLSEPARARLQRLMRGVIAYHWAISNASQLWCASARMEWVGAADGAVRSCRNVALPLLPLIMSRTAPASATDHPCR